MSDLVDCCSISVPTLSAGFNTVHYDDIKLYTLLTIHVLSINSNGGFARNYSPYGIFHPWKDHYIDVELYTPLTVHVVSIDSNSCLT